MHRKQRILYLNDPEIVYRVETWNDESFYELSLLDKVFMISFVVNDLGEDYILWDFNNTDKKLLKGETLNIDLNNGYTAVLKINEYSSLLLEISFKK